MRHVFAFFAFFLCAISAHAHISALKMFENGELRLEKFTAKYVEVHPGFTASHMWNIDHLLYEDNGLNMNDYCDDLVSLNQKTLGHLFDNTKGCSNIGFHKLPVGAVMAFPAGVAVHNATPVNEGETKVLVEMNDLSVVAITSEENAVAIFKQNIERITGEQVVIGDVESTMNSSLGTDTLNTAQIANSTNVEDTSVVEGSVAVVDQGASVAQGNELSFLVAENPFLWSTVLFGAIVLFLFGRITGTSRSKARINALEKELETAQAMVQHHERRNMQQPLRSIAKAAPS